jgi:predicted nucleotidyltransferase
MTPLVDLPLHHMRLLLELLAEHTPWAEVWAFGSRISGCGHEGSDLDIVLRNRANPLKCTKGSAGLKVAIQESSLPMLVDTHDWAHLPDSFHAEISRMYVVLQDGGSQEGRLEMIKSRLKVLGYEF